MEKQLHVLEEIRDLIKLMVKVPVDEKEVGQKPKWLDNQDLMLLLNVSSRTLQRWRDEKIIPFCKIRGKIWYKAEDVEALLKRLKR